MTEGDLGALVRDYGMLVIAPLALLEGPVISVISGYMAKAGLIRLPQVYALLVLAALAGDVLLYTLGRQGRAGVALPWLAVFGVSRRRLAQVLRGFRANGGRLLVIGKLTHSAGFAVLLAAGMARMPLARFLALNLLATLPKVAAFLALGWWFGQIADHVGNWLLGGTLLVLACAVIAITFYLINRKRGAE
jgi:membrane-associated protein